MHSSTHRFESGNSPHPTVYATSIPFREAPMHMAVPNNDQINVKITSPLEANPTEPGPSLLCEVVGVAPPPLPPTGGYAPFPVGQPPFTATLSSKDSAWDQHTPIGKSALLGLSSEIQRHRPSDIHRS